MKTGKAIQRIGIHIAGWILLYLLPPLVLQTELKLPENFGDYMYWSIVIVFFYINYLWLVPHYLSKRRFGLYFTYILFMLVFAYSANEVYIRRVHRIEAAKRGDDHNRKGDQPQKKRPRFKGYNAALFNFALLALGTSIRVTQSWYDNEKQRKEMENQKLGAELSLLKSQINPHFFFNTLNSIYSLAIIKSDKTPEAVLKLSEIMRYIIYDTERKVVPLAKEVEYIANYIELQRLRLPPEIRIDFRTSLIPEEAVIEPLLLLPFVENAFKHGVDIEHGGSILINITQNQFELRLHVENPLIEDDVAVENAPSGIGMNNTMKRLKLLYQDNFILTSGPVEKTYVVDLILKLKENALSDS